MDTSQSDKAVSKFLSSVVRHAPEKIGVTLDDAADVDLLQQGAYTRSPGLTFDTSTRVVANNAKHRSAFNDDYSKIKAHLRHSINIDNGFKAAWPPDVLYHGTAQKNINAILQKGIIKRNRHHVHLSADRSTTNQLDQRLGATVVLDISPKLMKNNGYKIYGSNNSIWLTDAVPETNIYVVKHVIK
ncbi:UNVERIFIED_CONTAM: hypothetical protein GTU68_045717 [Idotea baltica]|nr:hypothetical protein [Idotea baltica]